MGREVHSAHKMTPPSPQGLFLEQAGNRALTTVRTVVVCGGDSPHTSKMSTASSSSAHCSEPSNSDSVVGYLHLTPGITDYVDVEWEKDFLEDDGATCPGSLLLLT